jgi:hypothetical protein
VDLAQERQRDTQLLLHRLAVCGDRIGIVGCLTPKVQARVRAPRATPAASGEQRRRAGQLDRDVLAAQLEWFRGAEHANQLI